MYREAFESYWFKATLDKATYSRSGQPLSDRAFWRAVEWCCWLLFYSLPCVADLMPWAYKVCFALLLKAVLVLLKDVVVKWKFTLLTSSFWHLFSKRPNTMDEMPWHSMSINYYILQNNTNVWQLWNTSNFSFKDGIGGALQLVTVVKSVPVQIAERCIMHQLLPCKQSFHLISCLQRKTSNIVTRGALTDMSLDRHRFQILWKGFLWHSLVAFHRCPTTCEPKLAPWLFTVLITLHPAKPVFATLECVIIITVSLWGFMMWKAQCNYHCQQPSLPLRLCIP